MSYEIVKTLRLEQKDNNFWYAVLKTASNNVYPHYYSEWTYGKDDKYNYTKEQLQQELLLDFYYGNLKGGKSTKYGQFMSFLGNSWGCINKKSRACNTYHFYDTLEDRLRQEYLSTTKNGCWEFETDNYKKYCKRSEKLEKRQNREVKRYLYNEFKNFSDTCKPTVIRIWEKNWLNDEWHGTESYIFQYKRVRNRASFTDFDHATKFTSKSKLEKIKRMAENSNYRVEFTEV